MKVSASVAQRVSQLQLAQLFCRTNALIKNLLARIRGLRQRLTRREAGDAVTPGAPRKSKSRSVRWPDHDLPDERDGWETANRRRRDG